jgi:pterin-4a-carbinolamine dehydratase
LKPSVFISYRRRDSSAVSRWLAEAIGETFGLDSVFIDVDSIRVGEQWPRRIEAALKKASVLIVVIGQSWLRISDDYGRRLLDQPGDWVRNEILHAIKNKRVIIPLVTSRTELPKRTALPKNLGAFTDFQAYELRDDHWETDLKILLSRLEEVGFKRVGPVLKWPFPVVDPKELTDQELEEFVNRTTNWYLNSSHIPGKEPAKRLELMKSFEFHSFEDALHFMARAGDFISRMNHHPRWQNTWRSVTVWLSTWDIGHRPSRLDVELAEHLDALHRNYVEPVLKKVDDRGYTIWEKDPA